MTAVEIAELWGVTKQAVGRWHSDMDCPRNRDGSYNLPEVIAWRERRMKRELDEAKADTPRARRERIAEEREQFEFDRLREKYIKVEEVEQKETRKITVMKADLKQVGRRVVRSLGTGVAGGLSRKIQAAFDHETAAMMRTYAGQKDR